MIKDYWWNRFSRFNYMKKMRAALPEKYHAEIFDRFANKADHAMYISEGTPSGLFQSIMMKPSNIASVYPLRSENKDN